MSAKRDMSNNTLIVPFVNQTTYQTNTGILTANYDLFTGRMQLTRMMLLIVMSGWGAGGSVVIRLQDCATSGGAYATRATLATVTRPAATMVYFSEHRAFRRFVRLSFDVTGNSVTMTILGILQRGRREPVTQFPGVAEVSITEVWPPEIA